MRDRMESVKRHSESVRDFINLVRSRSKMV